MSQHANPNETYDLKQALRRTLKERRAALTAEDRRLPPPAYCSPLAELARRTKTNAADCPFPASPNEADLSPWMDSAAWLAGLQLFAPVVGAEAGQMDFYPLRRRTTIRQGRFGLREPRCARRHTRRPCNLGRRPGAPCCGFDDQGHRLGMGGGYYDRYFCSVGLRP